MFTPRELAKQNGKATHADIEWLNQLIGDWQLIADLVFADLVLWVPAKDGGFIALAHARPSSAATLFYRDITGQSAQADWLRAMDEAFESGAIVDVKHPEALDGQLSRLAAIPVRRKLSARSEEVLAQPIALITKHTNLADAKAPNKLQLNYLAAGNDLLHMVTEGAFPVQSPKTGSRRGAPRANDGLLRLNEDGIVQFASPNGLSAFNRLGIAGELEGKSLLESAAKLIRGGFQVDESLPLVLEGTAPWRADLESREGTLSVRAIPLKRGGERIGALVLCRDVTDLRRQERELITKDATIREIHHRVKNNLQTVASLLRIQARRSESEDARESLNQAMRRVSAIALVHDTLSEGVNQDLNFDEVFDRVLMLTSEVAASSNTTVRTMIDGKFGMLKSDLATPLAVALTEVVTNAIEHGLADRSGVVHINAERKPKSLNITVSDNGRGLEGGVVGQGLGTQIIRTLIQGELRGTISWMSPADGGTRVVIAIPL
ncbi:MAG: PAS domain-containing sensor histidine kinase [Actinomycetales bacterium]|nr:PAS domain-containing sensor histidine kinase [Actinomycetales bacterium]